MTNKSNAAVIVLDSSDDDSSGDGESSQISRKSINAASVRRAPFGAGVGAKERALATASGGAGGVSSNLSQNKVTTYSKRAVIAESSHPTRTTTVVTNDVHRKNVQAPTTITSPTLAVTTASTSQQPRRIKPTMLSSTVSLKRVHLIGDSEDEEEAPSVSLINGIRSDTKNYEDDTPNKKMRTHDEPEGDDNVPTTKTVTNTQITPTISAKAPITAAFASLLAACREADQSDAMERLITRKLLRYYHSVHPEFVGSKSFSRALLRVAADIRQHPKLVYMKLDSILEELRVRHRSGEAAAGSVSNNDRSTSHDRKTSIIDAETDRDISTTSPKSSPIVEDSSPTATASTGNAKKDQQIRRLNHALHLLKKRIARLEESEVDLNDEDNSVYLLGERYKKRACEIYAKICDITGESRNACRSTRQPIVFQGTAYPLFNRTIQSFVNRTRVFPDLHDVRRCLEHCNQQYEFGMDREEVRRVAQDAFVKIGKLLQRRRKLDLYETVTYLTSAAAGTTSSTISTTNDEHDDGQQKADVDPALNDVQLQRKLAENATESRRRMHEIIDRFAVIQDEPELKKSAVKAPSPVDSVNDVEPKQLESDATASKVEQIESIPYNIAAAQTEISPAPKDGDAVNTSYIVLDDD